MIEAYLILSGLIGLISHYYVRFKQGRTASTFKEYMLSDWPSTLQSFSANIASSTGIYLSLPDEVGGKMLVGAIYASYMAGYVADSMLNRDANLNLPQSNTPIPASSNNQKNIEKEVKNEIAKKDIKSILSDDAGL